MNEDWKQVLGDLIVGYFSDQGAEAGLREAASVSSGKESLHQEYVSALEAGIASAARGETGVIRIVRPIKFLKDPADAKAYLEGVLARYRELHEEAVKATTRT